MHVNHAWFVKFMRPKLTALRVMVNDVTFRADSKVSIKKVLMKK